MLFATDIAARGLDFKKVHWVLQLDCPDSVESYIHRAGRTARYDLPFACFITSRLGTDGSALLVISPSEMKMIEQLDARKIPLEEIGLNPNKQVSIQVRLQELLVKNEEIRLLALKVLTLS